tara:strand:+ start:6697 stop:7251 length:555 start_codon:yes stop_codon:yes gene_type:complete
MKTRTLLQLLIWGLLIFGVSKTGSAQEFFVGYKADLKMALDGPGHSYDQTSSHNFEVFTGFEFKKSRVLISFEDHDAIDYSKWFLEYSKKVSSGRFNFFAGVEVGGIWRSYDYELTNFNKTVEVSEHSFTVGVVLETQVEVTPNVYLTAAFNTFTTEGGIYSTIHQFLRYDVMCGVTFKTNYLW